jgi:hypothetical protein
VSFPGDEPCRAAGSVHEDESIGQDDMAATERGSMTEFIEIRGRASTTSGTCLFACSTRSWREHSVSSTRTPAVHPELPAPLPTAGSRRHREPQRGFIVDQKRLGGGSHSTVETITDIYTVLRLLVSCLGEPHVGYSNAFSFNDPQGMCPSITTRNWPISRARRWTFSCTARRASTSCASAIDLLTAETVVDRPISPTRRTGRLPERRRACAATRRTSAPPGLDSSRITVHPRTAAAVLAIGRT